MYGPWCRCCLNEDGPEVIDVGERRPGHDRVAQGLEESVRVIPVQAVERAHALGESALERVRRKVSAGDFFLAVDAIGITGQAMQPRLAAQGDGGGKQEFHVAPAPA